MLLSNFSKVFVWLSASDGATDNMVQQLLQVQDRLVAKLAVLDNIHQIKISILLLFVFQSILLSFVCQGDFVNRISLIECKFIATTIVLSNCMYRHGTTTLFIAVCM